MGLMDALLGAAQQAMGGQTARAGTADVDWASLLMGLLTQGGQGGSMGQGGLGGLLQQLQAAGLGEQVQSWISTGPNQAISGDQLSAALGTDVIGSLADEAGVSNEGASDQLSQLLPQLVDRLSPNGQLPDGNSIDVMLGQLLGR